MFILISNVIIAAAVFAAGELYVRLAKTPLSLADLTEDRAPVNPMRQWAQVDAFCAYKAKPGKYLRHGVKTVNEHGFISTPPIEVAKPRGTMRIVFLGGSSTAGTGYNLDDVQTWPWKTIELLRKRFPDRPIDFINAALGGYSSFESFGRLWSRLRFFSPDLIVVCHGWNEMYYFPQRAVERSHLQRTLPDGSWSVDRTARPIRMFEPSPVDPWISWSQVLTRVRIRLSQGQAGELGGGTSGPLRTSWDPEAVDIWRTNLRLMRETSALLDAELYVVKQATLIVPDLPAEHRQRCRYDFHSFDHDAHVEAFAAIYRVIDDEIAPDHIIDATSLSGRPQYFFDHVHPTEEGTTAIADIVAEALAPRIEPPHTPSRGL